MLRKINLIQLLVLGMISQGLFAKHSPSYLNAQMLSKAQTTATLYGNVNSAVSHNLELGTNVYAMAFVPNIYAKYRLVNVGGNQLTASIWTALSNPLFFKNWKGEYGSAVSLIDSVRVNHSVSLNVGFLGGSAGALANIFGNQGYSDFVSRANIAAALVGFDFRLSRSVGFNFSLLPFISNNGSRKTSYYDNAAVYDHAYGAVNHYSPSFGDELVAGTVGLVGNFSSSLEWKTVNLEYGAMVLRTQENVIPFPRFGLTYKFVA